MSTAAPLQNTKSSSFSNSPHAGLLLQRKCACGSPISSLSGKCEQCKEKRLQAKLTIGASNDPLEQEADRVADQVLAAPAHSAVNGAAPRIQRFTGQSTENAGAAPASVDRVLSGSGRPLDPALQQDMGQRFGHDFSQVQVHIGTAAEQSARGVNAQAYTVGNNIVFGAGRFAPESHEGRRLIAHELTHVVQQNKLASPLVQRQVDLNLQENDMDLAAEREYGNSGAPKAQKCGKASHCPAGFCDPYSSDKLAEYYRSKKAWWLMAGISAAVNSRVVPLWQEYLWGGSSPKNLTSEFGKDFTNSPTTKKTTIFLYDELKKSFTATPPVVPQYSNAFIDISTQIPRAISEIDDPASYNQMNFNIPKDIPGNLAGGIGKDQTACPAGAKPSPFNDERHASGMVKVTRLSSSDLTVTPDITYSVKDTIDLCPGDCGTPLEQIATVPLSQFEATGISGDVPFTVDFPAPVLDPFTVSVPLSTTPSPAPSPKKP